MHNESILNILYLFGKNWFGRKFYRFAYWFSFNLACIYLKLLTKRDYLYLKGSYAQGSWDPIVSDLDFVVVYAKDIPESDLVKISFLKKFLPIVKDVDALTEESLDTRIKYGSYKNCDFDRWRCIGREYKTSSERFSYPKKNILDRLEDIYFYIEWLFINLKDSENHLSSYRLACTKRNLFRLLEIVEKLNPDSTSSRKIKDEIKTLSSNASALKVMYEILSHINTEEILDILDLNKTKEDVASLLERDYYRNNFSITGIFEAEKICLPPKLFILFYSVGILDTYVLYEMALNSEDRILSALGVVKYCLKLEDGKFNHVHKSLGDFKLRENLKDAISLLSHLKSYNPFENTFGKNVFVTSSWGHGYLEALRKSHGLLMENCGAELIHLHVAIGGDEISFKSIENLATVQIAEDVGYEGLWHKESLFNLALNFCTGAKVYIFSDIDVVIKDPKWLQTVVEKLKDHDAVQPFSEFRDEGTGRKTISSVRALEQNEESFYAPGLIWGFSEIGMRKLGRFVDHFHDGSNDGVLFKNITKADLGLVERLAWTSRELFENLSKENFSFGYTYNEIEHISHPVAKQYDNMIQIYNLLMPELKKEIVRDDIGIWKWKNPECQFKVLFTAFLRDRGFFSNELKKSFLMHKEILLHNKVAPSKFYLDETKKTSISSDTGSLAFLVNGGVEDFQVVQFGTEKAQDSSLIIDLDELEEGRTYSISLLFDDVEGTKDLSAGLVNCYSDDIVFNPYLLNEHLSALTINFYAFKNFPNPKVSLCIKAQKFLGFTVKSIDIDSYGDLGKGRWTWVGEDKVDEKTKSKVCYVEIPELIKPCWHMISVKLGNLKSAEYRASIVTKNNEVLSSPRIQKNSGNYLGMLFKVPVVMNGLKLRLEFDEEEEFEKEVVYFSERKIS